MFRWSDGFVGYGIRYLCVNRLARSCGKKVLIFPGCILHWLENCRIGENVTIHDFCYIDAIGGITIGDDVRIAHNCSVITGQHKYDVPDKTIIDSGYTTAAVSIGNDVWVGTGAVILQGVTINDGAVIGANAVVTRDVPAYTVAAGNPAAVIKNRFPKPGEQKNRAE
jgi:acetyltransferase-like isoleucine patch superfamily enzyme